jgi:hypothetical protein
LTYGWPAGGERRLDAYQRQHPYSCVKSQNVRTQETLEERDRGGQRPGLRKAFTTELGSGSPVRMLAQCREAVASTKRIFDDFLYSTFPSVWSAASWLDGVPIIIPSGNYLTCGTGLSNGCGITYSTVVDFDDTADYTLSLTIRPTGNYYGDSELAFRMDDTTPDVTVDGCRLVLSGSATDGEIDASLSVYVSSVETSYPLSTFIGGTPPANPVRFNVEVSGNVATVTANGTSLGSVDLSTHGAAAGSRFGIGMNYGASARPIVGAFFLFYIPTNVDSGNRVWTLAASNGSLYSDDGAGGLAQVTGDSTLASDLTLYAVEHLGKLYIADYAESSNVEVTDAEVSSSTTFDSVSVSDWTTVADADDDAIAIDDGNAAGTHYISTVASGSITLSATTTDGTGMTARVVRAPKVWDSTTNTISIWQGTSGNMPLECSLICRFMGGIVLAGQKRFPHIAYHSASGDPDDWYTGSTSPTGAYATTLAENDVIGQPIRALIPYKDDYLIYGCTSQMWVQRGSLRLGGTIVNVSRSIGILGQSAWCFTPEGYLVWCSSDGLYAMPASGGTPEPVSRDALPDEFRNLDPSTVHVQLAWDFESKGIKIALTTVGQNRTHWFFHWKYRAFWREKYQDDHQPTALLDNALINETPTLLIGCADGYVREHLAGEGQDDGYQITSYVDYGPIRLGRSDLGGGTLDTLVGTLGYNSANARWSVFVAESAQEVSPPYYGGMLSTITTESGTELTTESGATITTEASASVSGTFAANRSYYKQVRRRGGAFLLEVGNVEGNTAPWVMENVVAVINDGGIAKL